MTRRPIGRGRGRTSWGDVAPGGGGGDTTPPGVTSIVAIATGITITLNEACDQTSTPAAGAFSSTGTHATFGTPSWTSATTLSIPCSDDSRITDFETVTLSYTAGANPIRDVALNNLANFSGAAVTNSSTFLAGAILLENIYRAASFVLSGSTVTDIIDETDSTSYATSGSPAYNATILNGRPAIDFDGTDDMIAISKASVRNCLVNQAAHHLFYVAQYDSDDALQAVIAAGNPGVSNNGRCMFGLSTSSAGRHNRESVTDAASTVAVMGVDGAPDTSPHVYEWFGTTTETLKVDGVIDGGTPGSDLNARAWAPGTMTPTGAAIGAYPTAGGYARFLNGKKSFLVLFDAVQTGSGGTNDPADIRAYLYFLSGLTGV